MQLGKGGGYNSIIRVQGYVRVGYTQCSLAMTLGDTCMSHNEWDMGSGWVHPKSETSMAIHVGAW